MTLEYLSSPRKLNNPRGHEQPTLESIVRLSGNITRWNKTGRQSFTECMQDTFRRHEELNSSNDELCWIPEIIYLL